MLTRGPLLLHDNAPAHMPRTGQAVVKNIGFQQLSHPPYSPDLAPSDLYLFGHLKKHLRGTRFCDEDEVKQAKESYLDRGELKRETRKRRTRKRGTNCRTGKRGTGKRKNGLVMESRSSLNNRYTSRR